VQDIEASWITRAQYGDPDAFPAIIETFERPVYNLCYRMLGNAEDAEDAAQETFLRAYKSISRYDNDRSFGTWLLSIAAHYCIDQIRRQRYPIVSIEDLPVPEIPDHSPGLESLLGLKEEQIKVRSLLRCLDPVDRAATIMYYWNDMSYDEICQALDLSVSALKSRLHRARRAMALQWQKQEPQPGIRERILHESPTV
jgi:RNA polymerase sigma-70 factor, ECF subfamily